EVGEPGRAVRAVEIDMGVGNLRDDHVATHIAVVTTHEKPRERLPGHAEHQLSATDDGLITFNQSAATDAATLNNDVLTWSAIPSRPALAGAAWNEDGKAARFRA